MNRSETQYEVILQENNFLYKLALFKLCKISTFNFRFLGSVILYKLNTTASSNQHNFGLIRHRNINNIYISYMKSKVTAFLNNLE